MKTLERFCETVRRVISVFDGNVYDLRVGALEFLRGERHASAADVFSYGHSAERSEDPLVVERGQSSQAGYIFDIKRVRQVVLDEIDRLLKSFYPVFHFVHLHLIAPTVYFTGTGRARHPVLTFDGCGSALRLLKDAHQRTAF